METDSIWIYKGWNSSCEDGEGDYRMSITVMTVERFVSDDTMPDSDKSFIRE